MLLKCNYLFLIGILLFIAIQLPAQDSGGVILNKSDNNNITDSLQKSSNTIWKPSVSPFIELLGKGFLSVNVDYRITESHAVSIGLQPLEGLMPDVMYYYLSGKRHRFEIGGGLSLGFTNTLSLGGILIHGIVGYRYQKKKGLFFRAGFTPLYTIFISNSNRNSFLPLAGISLGYSF
jgi:hypothetical protein